MHWSQQVLGSQLEEEAAAHGAAPSIRREPDEPAPNEPPKRPRLERTMEEYMEQNALALSQVLTAVGDLTKALRTTVAQQASPGQADASQRQPLGPSPVAATPPATPVLPAGAPPATKVPDDLAAQLKKVVTDFEKGLRKSINNDKVISQLSSQVLAFQSAQAAGKFAYPPGVRPSRSIGSFKELGTTLEDAKDAEARVIITFAKGTTIREAIHQMHWHYMFLLRTRNLLPINCISPVWRRR